MYMYSGLLLFGAERALIIRGNRVFGGLVENTASKHVLAGGTMEKGIIKPGHHGMIEGSEHDSGVVKVVSARASEKSTIEFGHH